MCSDSKRSSSFGATSTRTVKPFLVAMRPTPSSHDSLSGDTQPLAPGLATRATRPEDVRVDAIGNHFAMPTSLTQRPHPVDELGRAAGHELAPAEESPNARAQQPSLGEKHVTAVKPVRQPRRRTAVGHRRPGSESVGHDPVGVNPVEALRAKRSRNRSSGAAEIQRRRQRRLESNGLVALESPGVADHLQRARRVGKAPGHDSTVGPGLPEHPRHAAAGTVTE